jgi:hypothetical protein
MNIIITNHIHIIHIHIAHDHINVNMIITDDKIIIICYIILVVVC